jgi:hypothetical protein
MKIETKEIYKCEHCNKLYQIKDWCEYHESICKKNPENNRACFLCAHLVSREKVVTLIHGYNGQEENRQLTLMYCNKIKTFLYPAQVEVKGNAYDLGDESNNPMPKECELLKELQSECDLF